MGNLATLKTPILTFPNSGAEKNVMDMQYVVDNGLEIKTDLGRRNYHQLADGSCDKPVG